MGAPRNVRVQRTPGRVARHASWWIRRAMSEIASGDLDGAKISLINAQLFAEQAHQLLAAGEEEES